MKSNSKLYDYFFFIYLLKYIIIKIKTTIDHPAGKISVALKQKGF